MNQQSSFTFVWVFFYWKDIRENVSLSNNHNMNKTVSIWANKEKKVDIFQAISSADWWRHLCCTDPRRCEPARRRQLLKESLQRYWDWISLAGSEEEGGGVGAFHTPHWVWKGKRAQPRRRVSAIGGVQGTDGARGLRWETQNDGTAESFDTSVITHSDRAAPSTRPLNSPPPHSSPLQPFISCSRRPLQCSLVHLMKAS